MTFHRQAGEEYKRGPISFIFNVAQLIGIIGMLLFAAGNSLVFKKPFNELCVKVNTFMTVQAKENTIFLDSIKSNSEKHKEYDKRLDIYSCEQEKIKDNLVDHLGRSLK